MKPCTCIQTENSTCWSEICNAIYKHCLCRKLQSFLVMNEGMLLTSRALAFSLMHTSFLLDIQSDGWAQLQEDNFYQQKCHDTK